MFLQRIRALPGLLDLISGRKERTARTQWPELFVYVPDNLMDWLFCEVKGPGDRISKEQQRLFEKIASVSARPVYFLQFELVR